MFGKFDRGAFAEPSFHRLVRLTPLLGVLFLHRARGRCLRVHARLPLGLPLRFDRLRFDVVQRAARLDAEDRRRSRVLVRRSIRRAFVGSPCSWPRLSSAFGPARPEAAATLPTTAPRLPSRPVLTAPISPVRATSDQPARCSFDACVTSGKMPSKLMCRPFSRRPAEGARPPRASARRTRSGPRPRRSP